MRLKHDIIEGKGKGQEGYEKCKNVCGHPLSVTHQTKKTHLHKKNHSNLAIVADPAAGLPLCHLLHRPLEKHSRFFKLFSHLSRMKILHLPCY